MAMVKVMVRQTCVNPVEPSYFLRLRQVVYLQAHWKNRQTTTRAPVLAVGERDSWECRVAMIPNQTIITLAEGACDALQPAANRQTDLWTRNLYSGVGMRRMGWWARAWVNKHGHWDGDGDGDGDGGMSDYIFLLWCSICNRSDGNEWLCGELAWDRKNCILKIYVLPATSGTKPNIKPESNGHKRCDDNQNVEDPPDWTKCIGDGDGDGDGCNVHTVCRWCWLFG